MHGRRAWGRERALCVLSLGAGGVNSLTTRCAWAGTYCSSLIEPACALPLFFSLPARSRATAQGVLLCITASQRRVSEQLRTAPVTMINLFGNNGAPLRAASNPKFHNQATPDRQATHRRHRTSTNHKQAEAPTSNPNNPRPISPNSQAARVPPKVPQAPSNVVFVHMPLSLNSLSSSSYNSHYSGSRPQATQ